MTNFLNILRKHDPLLSISLILVTLAGLLSMNTFGAENVFFSRQIVWVGIGFFAFFLIPFFDVRFIRKTTFVVSLYFLTVLFLTSLLFLVDPIQGAKSWFTIGSFAFQPSDPAKLVLIIVLAKYFSRRHIEIENLRHILTSGAYVFIIFALVLLQPDFGTAIIMFLVWLLLVLVSGISKKHLLLVFGLGFFAVTMMWLFVFADYQRDRVMTFLHPRTDIQGAGYNAYQSRIAVGSGELFGKGVGQGTQSKLRFLPEYETDFIFATFAEEWGFVGVSSILLLYFIIIARLISFAWKASTNFESFFIVGVAGLFLSHITIHAGMNLGLLPVTGTTIPFMSYGGSHLLTEFVALGIVISMRKHERGTHRSDVTQEMVLE